MTNLSAFPECQSFLDQVLTSQKPIAAIFATQGAAFNFRQRCWKSRSYWRRHNLQANGSAETTWDNITLLVRQVGEEWQCQGYNDRNASSQLIIKEIADEPGLPSVPETPDKTGGGGDSSAGGGSEAI